MPSLDIHTAVQTALILAILICILSFWTGIRSIRRASQLKFFRMRRDRMVRGWRLLFFGFGLILIIVFLNNFAEPLIYRFYPPTATQTVTPTITYTPTISLTPTITLSPTITLTPAITDTPTITPTPHVPLAIEVMFESIVTPNPDSVFSPLVFTQQLVEVEGRLQAVKPSDVFQNPLGHMYALFSYDKMKEGVQWTAIWYRGTEVVHYETKPWDGAIGGWGYADWNPPPELWLPGEYEVQIFVGLEWKRSGRFRVEGEPPTPLPTPTPSATPTSTYTPRPSPTVTLTRTLQPTPTITLTRTLRPSPTSTLTRTLRPSPTVTLTRTPRPTFTITPTRTITPTYTSTATKLPTYTPTTPAPTNTRAPTATNPLP